MLITDGAFNPVAVFFTDTPELPDKPSDSDLTNLVANDPNRTVLKINGEQRQRLQSIAVRADRGTKCTD